MKKMKALQIIAAAMAVTVAATSAPVNVFAYGETSASSTLFTDTQNISDYATWKDNIWNKKGSIIFFVGLTLPRYRFSKPSASLDMNLR